MGGGEAGLKHGREGSDRRDVCPSCTEGEDERKSGAARGIGAQSPRKPRGPGLELEAKATAIESLSSGLVVDGPMEGTAKGRRD